jgi:transcriptional regulator with GAF, ATPase, and Fis domain
VKNARVAACASSEEHLDALVRTLREAGHTEIVEVRAPEDLNELPDQLAAAVLFKRPSLGQDIVLQSHLQARGNRLPVIVIGGDPMQAAGLTCWFPVLPPRQTLAAIIDGVASAGPSSDWGPWSSFSEEEAPSSVGPKSWRRKSDMLVGDSGATRGLLHSLNRLAPSSGIILITGESGTGKELVARALHYCGPRARAPFIALNCAAIPESLFEAELFGYQRGAFTGATAARAGSFEAADKGTLFLDEIGDMPRQLQPKLLRVLETNEFTRLGSNDVRNVIARIVVATNRDLANDVREGRFREDLYYRLNVHPLHIEPLRSRPEDIPALVSHHLSLLSEKEQRPVPRLTPAALECLVRYSWPGNVRELVHTLARALLVASKTVIDAEHIDLPGSGEYAAIPAYRDAKQSFETEYFTRLMRLANGNIALAARLSDKTRKEIYEALKRVGLERS